MKSAASLSIALLLCALGITAIPIPAAKPYLLFSTWFTVSRVELDGSNYIELADAFAQDVDYHLKLGKLFWNDYNEGTIYQAELEDPQNATVIVAGLSRPSGLAVDWVNDRLYFSYSSAGSSLDQPKHLAYYDLVSGYVTEITDAVVEEESRIRPRSPFSLFFDLAVDPVNEKLYWTSGTQLVGASLNGENVQLVRKLDCYSRYIGLSEQTLYWTQDRCSSEGVRSLDLLTSEVGIIAEGFDYFNDVAVFEDTAFWTGFARISSAPVSGEGDPSVLLENFSNGLSLFRGARVVHSNLQPE